MSAQFPTFDGAPGLTMERVTEFKANGYNMYRWHLIEHAGTHLDAPVHFSESGGTPICASIAASAPKPARRPSRWTG